METTKQPNLWIKRLKVILIAVLLLYAAVFFLLLIINFKDQIVARAIMLMGGSLFVMWVLIGGLIQKIVQKKYYTEITTLRKSPILYFAIFATLLACAEEAIAVTITNLAPLYGVKLGEAYITASSNFFTVIFLHSVIAFVPMFFMLGFLLKRYTISPFQAFLLFGSVGVFAEITFAGPQALLNAPFWICVYGLMVYLPAHAFVNLERKKLFFLFYPFLIFIIAFSAIATAWIPSILKVPRVHFPEMKL